MHITSLVCTFCDFLGGPGLDFYCISPRPGLDFYSIFPGPGLDFYSILPGRGLDFDYVFDAWGLDFWNVYLHLLKPLSLPFGTFADIPMGPIGPTWDPQWDPMGPRARVFFVFLCFLSSF